VKIVPSLERDRDLLQRMYDVFANDATQKLARLGAGIRTLFQARPRNDVFATAAWCAGLGKLDDARRALSCMARLAGASLELGAAPGERTLQLSWPTVSSLTVRGPADPVTVPGWVGCVCAALISRDESAEATLLAHRPAASSPQLSWNPYWDAWLDAWAHALGGRIGPAGTALALALERADPATAFDEDDADFMLAVIAPAMEVMFHALDRNASSCDEAIEKGLDRHAARYRSNPTDEPRYLPIQLLGAIRLAERLGLSRGVDSPTLAILDDALTEASKQ